MIRKEIKFKDFDGNDRTEVAYFNLNQRELTRLNIIPNGGLSAYMRKIVENEDREKIMDFFEKLILASYGKRDEDGIHFVKKDENGHPLSDRFAESAAYDQLFMDLLTDTDAAIDFFNGAMGNSLDEETIAGIKKQVKEEAEKETE